MKSKTKTLVVDDVSLIVDMMKTILHEYGIQDVSTACDGLRALDLFSAALQCGAPYSLVFLDILMPAMNGQEVLKRMRLLEKEAGLAGGDRSTIIMATALHTAEHMTNALIEGNCTDYIVKPFSAKDLRGMLVKHRFVE